MPASQKAAAEKGFSLVELSIVLVILGLITGGILTGQNLIHAAELRANMTEISQVQTAMLTFKEKYFGLPGDIANATQFWPSQTINGNGNALVEAQSERGGVYPGKKTSPDNSYYDGERAHFFVQLKLAGMVEGQYDGSTTLGIGVPIIPSEPDNGYFITGYWTADVPGTSSVPNLTENTKGTVYLSMMVCNPEYLGGGSGMHNDCGTFQPEDLWNMDKKMDDGNPMGGRALAHGYSFPLCLDGANYDLDQTAKSCNVMIELMP